MIPTQHLSFLVVASLITGSASASPASQGGQSVPPTLEALEALETWRTQHGSGWRAIVDVETGAAEMIHGSVTSVWSAPVDEADAAQAAVAALASTRPMHRVSENSLELQRALFLPLGQIGSGDKWTVRFTQRVNGVRVVDGYVNVLLDTQGGLRSVQSSALPDLTDLDVLPTVNASEALRRATVEFRTKFQLDATRLGTPELVVDQDRSTGTRTARLCWQIDLQAGTNTPAPSGETYWIDAHDGAIARRAPNIHDLDVTGTVRSMATPGLAPDVASNPETPQVMKYVRVQSSAGTITTDVNGTFTYPGVNTPLSCTFTYFGTYNNVQNSAGAEYSLVSVIPPNSPTNVLMNPTPTDVLTAQSNAIVGVNQMVDWIHALNPSETIADISYLSNVNLAQTCNAYFDGGSINFFLAGGGCPNTCYSTVISHEQGHWLNVRFGTGNGSDGIGEGTADIWAMYLWDDPTVAADFFGPGAPIRTGLNTSPFCGDAAPGCHGGSHANGEPWMGAAWKVRARLNTTLGDVLGDLTSDLIFLSWNGSYNQTTLRSIIETQWLTLDDDDGVLDNGTPHFLDIDLGFRDQQFPGVTLNPLSVAAVTALPDTENEVGPYVVQATIVANANPPLTAKTLRWRVGSGAFTDTPMTLVSGSTYQASIPGQPYLARVQYAVVATDSAARTVSSPSTIPDQGFTFDVGTMNLVRFENFDSASSAGWTTGTIGDTSNPEVDWQRADPNGAGGSVGSLIWRDPAAGTSIPYCWGNDLGLGAGTNAAYSANEHNYLRSPIFDCSAATNTRLRFKSWVTVEGNVADQARVLVNGVEVYQNGPATRNDTEWGSQEYDIAALADGNASVQIEFRLRTNATNQLGGWNVDDLRLFYLTPIIVPCPPPSTYCLTSPNSVGGGALMSFAGGGNLVLDNLVLIVNNCPPFTNGMYYYGQNQTLAPFGNGYRCIGSPVFRLPLQQTDAFGDASRALDHGALPPGGTISAGQVWNFQFWYRNPAAGGAGFNLSDGLAVTFCP